MKKSMMYCAIGLSLLTASCDQKESKNKEEKIEHAAETTQAAKGTATTDTYTAGNAIAVVPEAVPQEVRSGFTTKYPSVTPIEWSRYEPSDDDDLDKELSYYIVRFNNGGTEYMDWFNNKGEWVKNSTILQGNPALPEPVNNYLHTNYIGYEVEEIKKENDKNVELFEIKIRKGDDKVKLKILPNGEIYKKR